MKIDSTQARARFSELIRRSEMGEEIIITRNGVVMAQIKAAKQADLKADDRPAEEASP